MHGTMGTIIQKSRKTKGMTQEQLSNLLGISSAAVSKWETGNALPDVALLSPLARALGCTVNDLVDFRPQLTPGEIDTLCNSARRMFSAGNFTAAADFCESRLREYPSDLNLAFRVGGLYGQYADASGPLQPKLFSRAIQLLEQAANLPDEELGRTIWQMLAGLYTENGEYKKALEALNRLPSCNARGRGLRASVLRHMGKLEEAAGLEHDNLIYQLDECNTALASLSETYAAMQQQTFAESLTSLHAEFAQLKTQIETVITQATKGQSSN